MKLPTGEKVYKRDHFHDKRCALLLYFQMYKKKEQKEKHNEANKIPKKDSRSNTMQHIAGSINGIL